MATIDNLEIQISASSKAASKNIDKLIVQLSNLSKSLSNIESGKFSNIANGIRTLADATQGFKGKGAKSAEINSLANALKNLSNVDTTSFFGISNALQSLSNGINSAKAIDISGISNVSQAISNLGGKNASIGVENLLKIKDDLIKFIQGINTVGSFTFDVTGLSNLISSISGLGTKISTQATANLPIIAKQLQDFVTQMNTIGALSFDTTNLSNLVTSISKIGGKNVTTAITNLPLLANALNQVFITLSNAPNINDNVIQMTAALAALASQGNKVSSSVKGMTNSLNSYSSSTKSATSKTKSLASMIGKFYVKYFLVIRAIKALGKTIEEASDYIEAYNYFDVSFNKVATNWAKDFKKYGYENAEAYAKSFEGRMNDTFKKLSGVSFEINAEGKGLLSETGLKNLGLNIQEVTQYAAQLASVTNAVGLTGEASLAAADTFTKLAGDISSLFNVDYKSVANNLQSGLIGQSRALYKYGIDITNATLQTYAYNLGIEKSVKYMTQAEKMQLRMIAILDQSKVSWGDLANTVNQPANAMRILKTQVKELGLMFGQLFIPILSKVIPILTGITIALKRLVSAIANLFGIKISYENMAQGLNDVDIGAEDLADDLDDVTKSAKKAKAGLREFDELKTINFPSSTDTDKSGGNIDLTDDILKAADEYQKAWQAAYDRMENKANQFADTIQNVFKRISDEIVRDFNIFSSGFSFAFDFSQLDRAKNYIKDIYDSLKSIFTDEAVTSAANTFWDKFLYSAGVVVGSITNIGFTIANNLLGGIQMFLSQHSGDVKQYIVDMFDIGTNLTNNIADIFKELSDIFQVFSGDNAVAITANGINIEFQALRLTTELLGKVFVDVWGNISRVLSENKELIIESLDSVLGIIKKLTDTLSEFLTSFVDNFLETYDNEISPALSNFADGFSTIIGTVLELWQEYLAPFFDDISSKIQELVSTYLGPAINNIIQLFGKVINLLSVLWKNILSPLVSFIMQMVTPILTALGKQISSVFFEALEIISNVFNTVIKVLNGVVDFLIGVFTLDLKRAGKGISEIFTGILDGIVNFAKILINKFIGIVENFINIIIDKVNFLIDKFDFAGKIASKIFGGDGGNINMIQKVTLPKLKGYATGGFPKKSDLFYANENGIPELVGTMGGKTAVAGGGEITGISDAIYSTSQNETGLLRTAVSLLEVIAEKEYGISSDTLFKSVQRSAKQYSQRTGKLAFD